MDPVRADRPRKRFISGDKEEDAAPPADRRIATRDRFPPGVVIIAIDDGGAGGEGSEDGFRPRNAAAVGQEGERKWRTRNPARAFERGGGRC